MESRNQFTFYRSYYNALIKLPPKQRLGVLEALITYALDGTEAESLDGMQEMAMILIRPTLDASRKKAEAGKLGGSKAQANRKQKASKGETENELEKEAEVESETEVENETEDECLSRAGFEKFWKMYPVKVGKAKAWEAWQELTPDTEAACKGLHRWKASKQWARENGRFIPRAVKFLEERHYDDMPPAEIPRGATGELGQAEMEALAQILREEGRQ